MTSNRDIGLTMDLQGMRIQGALESVRQRIARATEDSGRECQAVQLVAVSKTIPAHVVRYALRAGHRVFGENRVQEAEVKWASLKDEFHGIELHLIGPLQSNKTREAMRLFDVIESVDRMKIAETIAKERDRIGRCPKLYVEVNTGAESQKAGLPPQLADAFITDCRRKIGRAHV